MKMIRKIKVKMLHKTKKKRMKNLTKSLKMKTINRQNKKLSNLKIKVN